MSSWKSIRPRPTQPPSLPSPLTSTLPSPSRWITPSYFAVICTIALDEEPYIDEWIQYHLLLGFSHIYIYDNSETNTLQGKESNQVTIIPFPGNQQMLISRDLFVTQYKHKHKWVAHIDVDEFIVLKKHSSIIDFLQEYDDCESIALNWKMFGTANEVYYQNEPVTKRFRYCSKDVNEHYKCISKLNMIYKCISSHRPMLHSGHIYDTNRRKVEDIFHPNGTDDIACIHHYYSKSEEEFRKKINRSMADDAPKRNISLLEHLHERDNDEYNSDAWDIFQRLYITH